MLQISNIKQVLDNIDNLKCVIFDLDDTLYLERDYVKSGYKEVAKMFPQIRHGEKILWRYFKKKQDAIDQFLLEINMFSDEAKAKCLTIYREHIPTIRLKRKIIKLLEKIKGKGIKLGIITDGRPEGQRAKISSLNLEKYFDYIIITDELGGVEYRKPNTKAFEIMKEHFNFYYSEICYIGDNIEKDFIAPEKLGMKAIWYRNKKGLYKKN